MRHALGTAGGCPDRLIIFSDMQSGRERNTKMAAVRAVCLHASMSDIITYDGRDIMKKIRFYLVSLLPCPVSEHQIGAFVVPPSLPL